mmetsp:Transcript_24080/g.35686  ORF Transcript_24080/g.35686 Transcript_24080/m.35686 type:complete len:123 (-) Transcript_24080:344-712(-)
MSSTLTATKKDTEFESLEYKISIGRTCLYRTIVENMQRSTEYILNYYVQLLRVKCTAMKPSMMLFLISRSNRHVAIEELKSLFSNLPPCFLRCLDLLLQARFFFAFLFIWVQNEIKSFFGIS